MRVFENRVLRRIFGPKRDEESGEWRKFHNEKLNYLDCSPTIVHVIKYRRMRWARHVAHMGRGETCTGFCGKTGGKVGHWGHSGVDGRIILRWIFRKWDVGVWTGLSWFR
jgi:hypothetical protein